VARSRKGRREGAGGKRGTTEEEVGDMRIKTWNIKGDRSAGSCV